MPLYIIVKLVLLFTLCILYKQSNLQAKIIAQTYYRAYFTQQSKVFYSSKSGLSFLKIVELQSILMY